MRVQRNDGSNRIKKNGDGYLEKLPEPSSGGFLAQISFVGNMSSSGDREWNVPLFTIDRSGVMWVQQAWGGSQLMAKKIKGSSMGPLWRLNKETVWGQCMWCFRKLVRTCESVFAGNKWLGLVLVATGAKWDWKLAIRRNVAGRLLD